MLLTLEAKVMQNWLDNFMYKNIFFSFLQGWVLFQQLLIDLFKFLAPFLRNAELAKQTHLLYKVTKNNTLWGHLFFSFASHPFFWVVCNPALQSTQSLCRNPNYKKRRVWCQFFRLLSRSGRHRQRRKSSLLLHHHGWYLNLEEKKVLILTIFQGTLRVLLVLLHDFPEFLCDYHFSFCDVIPPNCIQMRNLILSAFPRNMRLPDPFTPNLKVWLLSL